MCGLQDLIPGYRTDVTISDGGKNVNIMLTQARKQLKEGSKKSPPKLMPISSEHTPPYSNFVSNVDNCAWHNGLSSKPMYLHQKARNMTALPTSIIVYYFVNHCTNNMLPVWRWGLRRPLQQKRDC